jgi:hypothetical protein
MIVIMMDANHISERLASMRQEMNDLRVINARYWVKSPHAVPSPGMEVLAVLGEDVKSGLRHAPFAAGPETV